MECGYNDKLKYATKSMMLLRAIVKLNPCFWKNREMRKLFLFLKLVYSCGLLCIFTEEIVYYALENDTVIHESSHNRELLDYWKRRKLHKAEGCTDLSL